ncbi:MAG: hypothetical protein ACR2P1_27700 [Pseudomonadales bacterium]
MSKTVPNASGPAWASWLGVVAVIFGILQTAAHGNEWMTQKVIAPGTAAVQGIPPRCPEDELVEEGISSAECELMTAKVRIMIASRPDWFRGFQMGLSLIGTVVAFGSIFIGAALVQYRSWAPRAAVITFAGLLAIDAVGFAAATNIGPLLRATYLWNILLWFFIHLVITVGAIAGFRSEITA